MVTAEVRAYLRRHRSAGAGLALAAVTGLVVLVAPITVVLGVARLGVLALLATGTWLNVRRTGVVDLGSGGTAAVGAFVGGVWPALAGVAAWVGVPLGALAGALTGGLLGAVNARVGRVGSAVTTLAAGAAIVGVGAAVPSIGGASGFHAVPLLTGSDRGDGLVLVTLLTVGVTVASWIAHTPWASAAAAAVEQPEALSALGIRPVSAGARVGAISGALLGVGGVALATASGSVAPATFGFSLSAGLALAALLGGLHPAAGVLGVGLVYGPAVVWPTVPILGDSPLLALAPIGLALLARRPAGLLRSAAVSEGDSEASPRASQPPTVDARVTLVLDATPTVDGGTVTLEVPGGEVVAVIGPNGAGKSTLLARVAGQLPDQGSVRLGDEAAPTGAVRRARAGLARSWQRPSGLDVAGFGGHPTVRVDASAAAWARGVLGPEAETAYGRDLVSVAARRPRVALLDEPAAHLDRDRVARFVRGLADGGCAVLMVEHRAEVVATADRVVRLDGGPT